MPCEMLKSKITVCISQNLREDKKLHIESQEISIPYTKTFELAQDQATTKTHYQLIANTVILKEETKIKIVAGIYIHIHKHIHVFMEYDIYIIHQHFNSYCTTFSQDQEL